jgi:hypothetical protein
MIPSKSDDWTKGLRPKAVQLLRRVAKETAILVANGTNMGHFRHQMAEFAEKWRAYKIAHEADEQGTWQPSKGLPENPVGTIWPYVYVEQPTGPGLLYLPLYPRNMPEVLGDYALLQAIHDCILSNCERIGDESVPRELTDEIWQNIITNVDGESGSEGYVNEGLINRALKNVGDDLMAHCEPADIAQVSQELTAARQPNSLSTHSRKLRDIGAALTVWAKFNGAGASKDMQRCDEGKEAARTAMRLMTASLALLNQCADRYGIHWPLRELLDWLGSAATSPDTGDLGTHWNWGESFTRPKLWEGENRSFIDEVARWANKLEEEETQSREAKPMGNELTAQEQLSEVLLAGTRGRRFRIALSFPGEHRAFVEQVASHLADHVGWEHVLYDKYYEAELARVNLDTYLQQLYRDESELIAVFLCADYERREWCGLEWRAIRDLVKGPRRSDIMPLRFDNTTVPGLFSIDGYVSVGSRTPDEVADLILQRLRPNSGPLTNTGSSGGPTMGDRDRPSVVPEGPKAVVDRLNRHPVVFFVMLLGSLASIIALAVTFWPERRNLQPLIPKPALQTIVGNLTISEVNQNTRKPVWDFSWPSADDEIIAVITGDCEIEGLGGSQFRLLAFWQVATDYETNYHVARRRVGGNYVLATLEGESALAGKWEFVVGGIEVEPTYSGIVSVVILAISNEAIAQCERDWLDDSNGWGFKALPRDGRLLISAPATFKTLANRRTE